MSGLSDDDLITRADDAVAFLRRVIGDEHPDYPIIDGSGQALVEVPVDYLDELAGMIGELVGQVNYLNCWLADEMREYC